MNTFIDCILKLLEKKFKFTESVEAIVIFKQKQSSSKPTNRMYINRLDNFKSKLPVLFKDFANIKKGTKVIDFERSSCSFVYPCNASDKDVHKLINMSLIPSNYRDYDMEYIKENADSISRLYFRGPSCHLNLGKVTDSVEVLQNNLQKQLDFIKTITSSVVRIYFKTTQGPTISIPFKFNK